MNENDNVQTLIILRLVNAFSSFALLITLGTVHTFKFLLSILSTLHTIIPAPQLDNLLPKHGQLVLSRSRHR